MKRDMNLILTTLKNLPQIIQDYFSDLPEEVLDVQRTPYAWTIREHLYHIVNTQELLYGRMEKIVREKDPVIEPYFPAEEDRGKPVYKSTEAAFEEYIKLRKQQVDFLESMDASHWGKEAKHAEYIHYNLPIILNHIVFHEYWHMYRIEELWLERDEYLQ